MPSPRKVLIAAAGFLLPFAAGEAYLRVADPFHYDEKTEWTEYGAALMDPTLQPPLRRGAVARYLGNTTRLSSRGWRTPEFAVPKPPGVFRVLLLGGSVAFGWGVEQGDEFPRLLERALNERRVAGDRRVEVINTGVPGWKLLERGKFLLESGFAYEPDLVLLMLVSTDVPDPAQKGAVGRAPFLPAALRSVRMLWAIENRYLFNSPGVSGPRFDHYQRISDEGLEAVKLALGLFEDACRDRRVPMVVIDTLNKAQTRDRCKELGIPRIESYVEWKLRRSWEIAATDAHPNAAGHRYFAKVILDGLDPRLFGPR